MASISKKIALLIMLIVGVQTTPMKAFTSNSQFTTYCLGSTVGYMGAVSLLMGPILGSIGGLFLGGLLHAPGNILHFFSPRLVLNDKYKWGIIALPILLAGFPAYATTHYRCFKTFRIGGPIPTHERVASGAFYATLFGIIPALCGLAAMKLTS